MCFCVCVFVCACVRACVCACVCVLDLFTAGLCPGEVLTGTKIPGTEEVREGGVKKEGGGGVKENHPNDALSTRRNDRFIQMGSAVSHLSV